MCVYYKSCLEKPLSTLLLDCWQREYDKRPYKNFIFDRLEVEARLGRNYHEVVDFAIIVEFLKRRPFCSVKLKSFRIVAYPAELLENFTIALKYITHITLQLMNLPNMFFQLLQKYALIMNVKVLSFEGSELKRTILPFLQEFLCKCTTLESLNINHCSILQYDFALLADGVYKSPKVTELSCNRLLPGTLTLETDKLMNILCQIVWQHRLTELEIQHNEFKAQDMETLAAYLGHCRCRLKKLNVAYNIIGADGAKYLLQAIVGNSTLTHLNMCGNELGTHGGEHVAAHVSACVNLQCLNISHNKIGVVAINLLLTALKKPLMLRRLELWGNDFNNYSAMVLKRLLDAHVMQQSGIDVTVTADEAENKYRIIPFIE